MENSSSPTSSDNLSANEAHTAARPPRPKIVWRRGEVLLLVVILLGCVAAVALESLALDPGLPRQVERLAPHSLDELANFVWTQAAVAVPLLFVLLLATACISSQILDHARPIGQRGLTAVAWLAILLTGGVAGVAENATPLGLDQSIGPRAGAIAGFFLSLCGACLAWAVWAARLERQDRGTRAREAHASPPRPPWRRLVTILAFSVLAIPPVGTLVLLLSTSAHPDDVYRAIGLGFLGGTLNLVIALIGMRRSHALSTP